jgi:Zn-dependent oligopeptidase
MRSAARVFGTGVLGLATTMAVAQSVVKDPLHIWVGNPDAAQARAWADAHLAAAQAQVDALLAVKGERTVENTLRRFDEAQRELDLAGSGASLLTNASPKKDCATWATRCRRRCRRRRRR